MFDMNTFDANVSKLRFEIKIWTLPNHKFTLEKLTDGKYFLHIFTDGREIFNHNNIHFEIHYEENDQIVALYFWNGVRGWYLNNTDVFDMDELSLNIANCISKKFDMMGEVFEKHRDNVGTKKNEVVAMESTPSKFKDFAFVINTEGKVVFVVKSWYERTQEIQPFTFPENITSTLNENGLFFESGNVWVEDGRFLSQNQMKDELDKMGFSYSNLLKSNL